ncbi:EamA family transporter [Haloarcula taiwanensis]|uniref:EamA family transporter n=1 Tax=Haloarcula taiwanensis TaxID=1932004 RepID=A0A2H5A399_9EURY|nr:MULTISPECIES: EamA family transporter [Haloarcula]AUG49175.1 EamA family transporter [Haloarcula taiwanensis]RLM34539.1 EamA/RhaT family transporter [Haloarcula sp. Atlit-120R]
MLRSAVTERPSIPARYRDSALFVLLAVLFGGSFVAIKTGLRELPPVLFAGLRFDLAAVTLLGYIVATRPRSTWLPQTRGDFVGIGMAALFLIALNNGLLFLGQGTTTPAAASVMYGLNPILAPVFAWWLLGDRLSWLGAVGIGIALSGVIIIVQPSPSTFTDASAIGQLLVLGAAAAVALGSVLLQRVSPQMDSTPLTAWAMAVGAVLLHIASLLVGEPPTAVIGIGPATIASIVAVGIPSTAVAYAIYFGLIKRIGPVRANLVAYVVPIFAALMGWVLLGSSVSLWTFVGFLVVVAGFALIERVTIRMELRRLYRRFEDTAPKQTPPCDD